MPRVAADDGAELAFVIDVLRDPRQHDGAAGTDDRRARLEEELGHEIVFRERGAIRPA